MDFGFVHCYLYFSANFFLCCAFCYLIRKCIFLNLTKLNHWGVLFYFILVIMHLVLVSRTYVYSSFGFYSHILVCCMLRNDKTFRKIIENQQNNDLITKISEIVVTIQKFQVSLDIAS